MDAKERAQKIKAKLEAIMADTFYDCKSANLELATKSQSINTLAHECTKELDKLISHLKKTKKDKKESKMYKPVDEGSLF